MELAAWAQSVSTHHTDKTCTRTNTAASSSMWVISVRYIYVYQRKSRLLLRSFLLAAISLCQYIIRFARATNRRRNLQTEILRARGNPVASSSPRPASQRSVRVMCL